MMPLALLLLMAMLPGSGEPRAPSTLFAEGNTLYQQGLFEDALTRFQGAVQSGGDPGILAYNSGNCLFRMGRYGRALHEYLIAERHRPRDSRIKKNISVTRDRLGGAIPERGSFAGLFRRAAGTLRADEYRSIGALLFATFLITAAGAFRKGKAPALRWVALLLLPGLVLYALSFAVKDGPRGRVAVVVEQAAQAFNEPSGSGDALFSLREGEIVAVADERRGWLRVSDSEGHSGWARGNEVWEVKGDSYGQSH
jgi:tetratricopeptide (TPR) repeat protein